MDQFVKDVELVGKVSEPRPWPLSTTAWQQMRRPANALTYLATKAFVG